MPVVAPVQDSHAARFDLDQAIVPRPRIVWRRQFLPAEIAVNLVKIIRRVCRINRVLVCDAGDLHIVKLIGSDQPIKQHRSVQQM